MSINKIMDEDERKHCVNLTTRSGRNVLDTEVPIFLYGDNPTYCFDISDVEYVLDNQTNPYSNEQVSEEDWEEIHIWYDDDFAVILERLRNNDPDLTSLILENNQIGPEGAQALADSLQHNTFFTALNLAGTRIGNEGARILADLLQHNTTLERLYLWNNRIEDEGAYALAEALKFNTTLTDLSLRGNRILEEGAQALAESLQFNTTLTDLDLDHNLIEYHLLREIKDLINNREERRQRVGRRTKPAKRR